MPWKVSEVKDQRIGFVARALGGERPLSGLCREFGISRPTGYHWLRRYQEVGSFSELEERSRRPRHSPHQTPVGIERRVEQLRRRYGWGARKLQVLLEREGVEVKEVTLNRILKRRGLIEKKSPSGQARRRFERETPNELWQMDFKGEYRCSGGYCYPLSILDDHSRYLLGLYALRSQQWEPVWDCMSETLQRYGVPQALLLDHGTPWWSNTNGYGLTRLSVELIKQGIQLLWSGIGHPQTQGKVERFHGTLSQRIRHQGRPQKWQQWPGLLAQLREEYNQVRPHEALGMQVPAQRYQPSTRAYQPHPGDWEYPSGLTVRKLSSQGTLYWGHYYFVCEALAGERVAIEPVQDKLLVRFRHLYIREIDLSLRRTLPLISAASGGSPC